MNPHTLRSGTITTAVALILLLFAALREYAEPSVYVAFESTWARTARPVAFGVVSRTWMWGLEANTGEL